VGSFFYRMLSIKRQMGGLAEQSLAVMKLHNGSVHLCCRG
jgi:hypothetical protein